MKVLIPVIFLATLQFLPFSMLSHPGQVSPISHLADTMQSTSNALIQSVNGAGENNGNGSRAGLERF